MYRLKFGRGAQKAPGCRGIRPSEFEPGLTGWPMTLARQISMSGGSEGHRLRIGDWRVIYEIDFEEGTNVIVRIRPRGGAYQDQDAAVCLSGG
jgi:hypothetical protein